jgi:hypothetical protein
MPTILFYRTGSIDPQSVNWYLNYKSSAPRFGPMTSYRMEIQLYPGLLSIGYRATNGFNGSVYFGRSNSYAYIVSAYPPGWTSEMRTADLRASVDNAAEEVEEIVWASSVASYCEWTNNTGREAQWAYMNEDYFPTSDPIPPGKQNLRYPLPPKTTEVGFGISNFTGRVLVQVDPPPGATIKLTLDNN